MAERGISPRAAAPQGGLLPGQKRVVRESLRPSGAIINGTIDIDAKDLFSMMQMKNLLTMSLFIILLVAGCSIERRLPKSVIDELSASAEELNIQIRGWSDSYLDDVSEVAVINTVSPTQRYLKEHFPHVDEFWCVTLELTGIRNGKPSSYEIDWFAILNEGSSECNLTPRHIVAYPYEYDLLCEEAVP